jgi:ubiquinone biosynthesis monooxygenase Coq7
MTQLPESIKSMIRVNQAGEYGATRIYAGQLAILKGKPAEKILRHMAGEEARHLQKFNRLVVRHHVRPTLLQPLWYGGGYVLGALTALMGEKAAHACTIAVEEVIEHHYERQLRQLENEAVDPSLSPEQAQPINDLAHLIEECRQDEAGHRQTAIESGGENAPAYKILSNAVKAISRTAIWLSTRI